MADPRLPPSLAQMFRDIDERLRNLETAPRLKSSAMKGGTIRIVDDVDVDRVVMGQQGDGTYGFRVNDADGSAVLNVADAGSFVLFDPAGNAVVHSGMLADSGHVGFRVLDPDHPGQEFIRAEAVDGLARPWITHAWSVPNTATAVTSGSYVAVYETGVEMMTGSGVQFRLALGSDVGTTGQVKVMVNGSILGSELSIGAGAAAAPHAFAALHGQPLNTGPHLIQVHARRTGGAGNFWVYLPSELVVGGRFVTTPAGGWY